MSYSDFKTRGVKIGSLFAIGIWVHWLLLLLVAYYFYDLYVDRASGPRHFGILATHLFATFVILLLVPATYMIVEDGKKAARWVIDLYQGPDEGGPDDTEITQVMAGAE